MKYIIEEFWLGKNNGCRITCRDGSSRQDVTLFQSGSVAGVADWRTKLDNAKNVAFSVLRHYHARRSSLQGRKLNDFIHSTGAVAFLATTFLFGAGNNVVITETQILQAGLVPVDYDPDTKTKLRMPPSWMDEAVYEANPDGSPVPRF